MFTIISSKQTNKTTLQQNVNKQNKEKTAIKSA